MQMRLSIYLLGLILMINTSCKEPDDSPVDFPFGWHSYMTEKAIMAATDSSRAWRDVSRVALTDDDPRPRYTFVELETDGLKLGKSTYRVRLEVFNDRLLSVRVFTESIEPFCLNGMEFLCDPGGDLTEGIRNGNLIVARYEDYEGRNYIIWQDVRLLNEHKQWILRYS